MAWSAPHPERQLNGPDLLAVVAGVTNPGDAAKAAEQLGFLSYFPERGRLPRRWGMGRSPDPVGTVMFTGIYDPGLGRAVVREGLVGDPVGLWLEVSGLVRHVSDSLQDASALRDAGDQAARRRLIKHLRVRAGSVCWTHEGRAVRVEAAAARPVRSAPNPEIARLALAGVGRLIEDQAGLVDGFSIRLMDDPPAGWAPVAVGLHARVLLAIAREWSRVLGGAQPHQFATCPQCGRTFAPTRKGQIWCSRNCRQLGYYHKRKAQLRDGAPQDPLRSCSRRSAASSRRDGSTPA